MSTSNQTNSDLARTSRADRDRSLRFAAAGYALALLLFVLLLGDQVLQRWFYAVWAAVSLAGLCLVLAGPVARFIATNRLRSAIGGALYAWLVVAGSTLSCGLLSLALYSESGTAFDWLVKPLFWVLAVGGLPAAMLGVAFGELTWRAHGRRC